MPEFVKPMKVRITLESLNGEDQGQYLYYDFLFFSTEDFEKDWNEFIQEKLDVLNKINNEIPF